MNLRDVLDTLDGMVWAAGSEMALALDNDKSRASSRTAGYYAGVVEARHALMVALLEQVGTLPPVAETFVHYDGKAAANVVDELQERGFDVDLCQLAEPLNRPVTLTVEQAAPDVSPELAEHVKVAWQDVRSAYPH